MPRLVDISKLKCFRFHECKENVLGGTVYFHCVDFIFEPESIHQFGLNISYFH